MKNKDKMKDSDVVRYYDQIREKYPAVELCSEIWTTFYLILMGDDPDKIDDFLEKYEGSAISPFVNGIKKGYRRSQERDILSGKLRLRGRWELPL